MKTCKDAYCEKPLTLFQYEPVWLGRVYRDVYKLPIV